MSQIPAGWYPDPYYPTQPYVRWWDGTQWTEHAAHAASHPSGPATTPDGQLLAGWWQRVAAQLIDGFIVSAIQMLLALPFWIVLARAWFKEMDRIFTEAAENPDAPPPPFEFSQGMVEPFLWVIAVALVVMLTYQLGFLRWKQATPGKLALGLRIRRRETPGPLPWSTILLRFGGQNWASLFSWIPIFGIPFAFYPLLDVLWPLGDDKKQALHDKIAKTNVVVHDRWVDQR